MIGNAIECSPAPKQALFDIDGDDDTLATDKKSHSTFMVFMLR